MPLAVAVGDTEPQASFVKLQWLTTTHVTPAFAGSLETVAVSCAVPPPTSASASIGATLTEIVPGMNTMTCAAADFVGSAAAVAFTVTFAGTGGVLGAM